MCLQMLKLCLEQWSLARVNPTTITCTSQSESELLNM